MIKACAGATVKVIGKSKAMASAGPMPGKTPTKVPNKVPRSPKKIFIGVIAEANPLNKDSKLLIIGN